MKLRIFATLGWSLALVLLVAQYRQMPTPIIAEAPREVIAVPQSAPAPATVPKSTSNTYEIQLAGEYPNESSMRASIEYSGGCLVSGSDGSSESKTITGITPQVYSYVGRGISCSYQKQAATTWPTRLKLVVKRNGTIVKQIETEAEYGIASFAI